jgi:hypothetical protein
LISKKTALQSILDDLDDTMDVLYEDIIEKDYGWIFFTDSKEFIRTGDFMHSCIGSGGTLVEKKTGNHISFGSAYPLEQNLKIYEKGYLEFDSWDIEITKVTDLNTTVEALLQLKLSYIEPEEECGTVWRIAKEFKHNELKHKLNNLPTKFNVGNLYFLYKEIESLKNKTCCKFKLTENTGYKNEK